MRLGASVSYAFWHRIRFVPDDVLAQIPAISAERERHQPRDANEVFVLERLVPQTESRLDVFARLLPFGFQSSATLIRHVSVVAVPEIKPERPIISQDAAHFTKQAHHALHVFIWRVLLPDLVGVSVVAQSPIRRRGHTALHARSVQCW